MAYTAKKLKDKVPVFLVALGALILRLSKVNDLFPFAHDQKEAAFAAYEIIVQKKPSLIGQELSFQGFFLGPLHDWVSLIPYASCNLKPDCVPYFFALLSSISVILLFFALKNIISQKTAIIASAIYAISFGAIRFDLVVNSNFFLFTTTILLVFCVSKYFAGKNIYLIIGAFLSGMATVNFNPVFIFTSAAFILTLLLRNERKLYFFVLAAFAFLINYFPLFIFNLRHNNILLSNFLNFLNQNSPASNTLEKFWFVFYSIMINFFSNFLFQSTHFLFIILTVFLLALGLSKIASTKNPTLYFFPAVIVVNVLGLTLYSGHIPDYYFQQSLLPLVVIVALALKRNVVIFLIVALIFLYTNLIAAFVNYTSVISYKIKKETVNYIIKDSNGSDFNVYYDMPPGLNNGYDYLFLAAKKPPREGASNLYFLEFKDPEDVDLVNYRKVFPNKLIFSKSIGFVQIISVK